MCVLGFFFFAKIFIKFKKASVSLECISRPIFVMCKNFSHQQLTLKQSSRMCTELLDTIKKRDNSACGKPHSSANEVHFLHL